MTGLALTGLVAFSDPAPAATPRCAGHRATIVGTDRSETLRGTSRGDVIVAKGGNDRISGGGGADIICAGPGADTITGAAGNDRIEGSTGNDAINAGIGGDSVTGGPGNDRVTGSDGNDRITGSDGKDTLSAGTGHDTLNAGAGDDIVTGGTGDDTLAGSTGNDTLSDTGGTNAINAGDGDDTVVGGANVDDITGGTGDDALLGGAGADTLAGGSGVDALLGMGGDDSVDGGEGNDIAAYLDATGGVDVSLATGTGTGPDVGTDSLTSVESVLGSPHGDHLVGSAAADMFFGNAGDDTIDGGDGNDFVLFFAATDGVIVELNVGGSTGPGEGSDTLTNIESSVGTEFDDVFYGNGADNYFDGLDGFDSAYAAGGMNVCYAEQTSLCGDILTTTGTFHGDVETATALARDVTSAQGGKLPAAPARTPAETPPGPEHGPDRVAPIDRELQAATGIGDSLSCPPLAGAVLTYPNWTGYGYWAYQMTYPTLGNWVVGPWMYNYGNSTWVAYEYGAWRNVTYYTSWTGYQDTFYAAWFWDYEDQQWYYMGQCKTQVPFLGYTMIPLNTPGCGYLFCGPDLPVGRTTAGRQGRRRTQSRQRSTKP